MAEDHSPMEGISTAQDDKCGAGAIEQSSSQVSSQGSSLQEPPVAPPNSTTIDSLPDGVLSAILSKLCEAHLIAQAAMVCKRWRSCSAGVDTLRLDFKGFHDEHGEYSSDGETSSVSMSSCSGCEHDVQSMREVYDRMVTKCTGLRELTIRNFTCVSKAMKEAFNRSIQNSSHSLEHLELQGEFELEWTVMSELSRCSKLQSLHLEISRHFSKFSSFSLNSEATSQFSSLKKCVLRRLDVDHSPVEPLLKLAPLIEELDIHLHSESLTLAANNLRRAKFEGIGCLTLDAPKLESVSIKDVNEFHTDGDALSELRMESPTKLVFKRTPRLKALELGGCGWSSVSIHDHLAMAKSAVEIQLLVGDSLDTLTFSQVFEDFPDLKKLTLGMSIVESFLDGNLENKIHVAPPLESVSMESPSANSKTIALVSSILELSSSLSSFALTLADRPGGQFCTQLLKLQSRYNKVVFKLSVSDDDFDDFNDEDEGAEAIGFYNEEDDDSEDDSDSDDDDDDSVDDDDGNDVDEETDSEGDEAGHFFFFAG